MTKEEKKQLKEKKRALLKELMKEQDAWYSGDDGYRKRKEINSLMKDLGSGHLRGDPGAIFRSTLRKRYADEKEESKRKIEALERRKCT
jgi:hypothetical protein